MGEPIRMSQTTLSHRGDQYFIQILTLPDGRTKIRLTTTNPPRGLDKVLYEFHGLLPKTPASSRNESS